MVTNSLNDQKIALDWIQTIEGEKARVRDSDIYPQLRSWIDSLSPFEILEIGCGQGICSDKINLDGRNYTGLELSVFLLDRAKALYQNENRKFVLGDAHNLPFSEGAFDGVFSVAVLHLLSDLQKAGEELSRVLKLGGHFLIISANPSEYSLWTDRYIETQLEGRRFEGKTRLQDQSVVDEVLYLHTLDEIKDVLQSANLKIEKLETFRKVGERNQFLLIEGQKILTE